MRDKLYSLEELKVGACLSGFVFHSHIFSSFSLAHVNQLPPHLAYLTLGIINLLEFLGNRKLRITTKYIRNDIFLYLPC